MKSTEVSVQGAGVYPVLRLIASGHGCPAGSAGSPLN